MPSLKFSVELERWLKGKTPKTLQNLNEVFGERTFAIAFLLLMFLPALPLPTGGITHVFEIMAMLLSLELIVGMQTVWVPKWWGQRELGHAIQTKAVPFIIRRIRWFERFSRPRLHHILKNRLFLSFSGLVVFTLSLGAFLAVPFSGLDTLPALGVVTISLGLILADAVIFIAGCFIGLAGIVLEVGLGDVLIRLIHHLI